MKKLLLNTGLVIAIIIAQVCPVSALYQFRPHQFQSEKLWTILKQPKTLIGLSAAAGVALISVSLYQLIKSLNKKSEQTITSLNQLLDYKNFTSLEGQKMLEIFFETATRGIAKGLQTPVTPDVHTTPTQPAYVSVLDHLAKTPAHQQLIIDTIQKLLTGILPLVLPQAQTLAATPSAPVATWQPIFDYIMRDEQKIALIERLLLNTTKTSIQTVLTSRTQAAADITTLHAPPLHDFVTFLVQTPQAADVCSKLIGTASHALGYGYAEADARAAAQLPGAPAPEGAVSKFFTFLKNNPILAACLARSLAAGYAKGDAFSAQLPSSVTGAAAPAPTLNQTQKHYTITQWFIDKLSRKKQ